MRWWRILIAGFAIPSTLLLLAGSPSWLKKDYKDWSDDNARALLSESPWAKKVPIPSRDRGFAMVVEPGSNSEAPSSASIGNNNGSLASNAGASGAGSPYPITANAGGNTATSNPSVPHASAPVPTPGSMARSSSAPELQPSVTVIWATARPVRLAQMRMRSGRAPTEEEAEGAAKPRDRYTIAVVGLPEPADQTKIPELARTAVLSLNGGKTEIQASRSGFRKVGDLNIYLFHFPRTTNITIDEKTAEFRVTLGSFELKKKFDLREMVYQGKLDL